MKIQKAELAAKLNKIKSVVPKKTTQSVLQGILVMNGCLTANNLEMAVKIKIPGMEKESFIIPDKAFDLINNLPEGDVEISAIHNHTIVIRADKIKNKYKTAGPELFPVTTISEAGSELTIKADVLLDSIRRVSYAVPAQGSNPVMSSLCLQACNGYLNFVGLDGHVLAWDRVEYDGDFELLIPKNTIDKIKLVGLSGDVQIRYNRSQAVFATEECEVYTRLVEGKYLMYQRMFSELPLHTSVSRTELLDAMTRAKLCTEEKCPVVFEMHGSAIELSIKDSSTDYHETIDLHEEMTKDLKIGFNARLVLETLKAFDCSIVKLLFGGPKMPMIIESEDSDFKTIVLPVVIS